MGRKSRAKRDRREQVSFVAALTNSEGSWLEQAPSAGEIARIRSAVNQLAAHRTEAEALARDTDALQRFSLQIFRDERFAPLYFDDWVVEEVLERLGEPPIAEDEGDTSFSDYLREAVLSIATARVRRAVGEQVRRFVPAYFEAGQIREALAIENNAYLTVMSDAVTPLLAQLMVGALSRWYDEHEEE